MKKTITTSDIKKFAASHSASEFERYCEINNIDVTWLDVTLTNYDEEYYNVELPQYSLEVIYYDGKLEELNEY
jgi:hypothetical protein